MSTTTKYISLDFYNNNIVNVYAKQSDANSRFINVTCTDHGKKAFIDNSIASAFVRMKKSDGNYIYNDTEILNDGTISITLTSQMLAVTGKQNADLMILSSTDITSDELNDLSSVEDLSDVSVISVMPFYIIVSESAIDNSIISSTSEFDALVQATARLKKLESQVRTTENSRVEAEEERENNEATRIANEKTRQSNETTRKSNETTRQSNETARVAAETKRQDNVTGEAYRIANEEARQSAFSEAITNAKAATEAANAAVAEFETIKDQSGIVLQSEKGVANGVATLNESGKVPSSQLSIANNLTTTSTGQLLDAYQGNRLYSMINDLNENIQTVENTIAYLPSIHFNATVDNSIGKDGDVLMVPIE